MTRSLIDTCTLGDDWVELQCMSGDHISRFAAQELWKDNRQEDLVLAEQENWDLPTCKYASSALT